MLEQIPKTWMVFGTLLLLAVVLGLTQQVPSVEDDSNSANRSSRSSAVPTSTPDPTKTPGELADDAAYFDPRLLTSNAEGHIGENIFVQGEAQSVDQHNDYTWISLSAEVRDRPITESVVIEMRPPESD